MSDHDVTYSLRDRRPKGNVWVSTVDGLIMPAKLDDMGGIDYWHSPIYGRVNAKPEDHWSYADEEEET